jgi:hypothetical protein
MPGDRIPASGANSGSISGPFKHRPAILKAHDALAVALENVSNGRGDHGANRETVFDELPLFPCTFNGQAGRTPKPIVKGEQAHLTRRMLKDLERRHRPDGRPLTRLVWQPQDVNKAPRLLAKVHEQPDRPGFRYTEHPASDMLAYREAGPGSVQLIRLRHARDNLLDARGSYRHAHGVVSE